MPYHKWLTVLRSVAQWLCIPEHLAPEAWTTYTFRRMLPTIADIVGLHEGHRQALGEWTESVKSLSGSSAPAQPLMCHRYADNKVGTAGETKMLVASAVALAKERQPSTQTWEQLRALKITVAELDAYAASLVTGQLQSSLPTQQPLRSATLESSVTTDKPARPLSQEPASPTASTQSSSSSQSSSSTEDDCIPDLDKVEWFMQAGPRARVHIQRGMSAGGRRLALCRRTRPFAKSAHSSGVGIQSLTSCASGVCDACLGTLPNHHRTTVVEAVEAAASIAMRNPLRPAPNPSSVHMPAVVSQDADCSCSSEEGNPHPEKWWRF